MEQDNPSQLVKVIACGPRIIYIPKSGLVFPAWQVSFSDSKSFWRSKLDFLKLSRVAAATQGIVFPKAAWTKLSKQAPWKRPDDIDDNTNDCYQNSQDHNQWQASMTKSLRQVDHFLAKVDRICQSTASTESVDDDRTTLVDAWNEFCREADTESLVVSDKDNRSNPLQHDSGGNDHTLTASSAAVGNALGQYFCSEENANQLITCFLDKLKIVPNLVIVEPSCGHGTVVATLTRRLEQSCELHNVDFILGLDLDPKAIQYCEKNVANENEKIYWKQADFLQSCRHEFLPNDNSEIVVAMIGGPPYSSGAGHADDMQWSLPQEFVMCGITDWKASVIAFIMPARCRNVKYQLPESYTYETYELDNASTFYFQGGKQVTQPSIIQVFWSETLNTND